MQPDLLSGRAMRWLLPPRFAIAVGVLAATVFGTITGLLIGAISPAGSNRLGSGLTAGALEGIVVGLACAVQCRRREVQPTRLPRLTMITFCRALARGLGWGLVGAAFGVVAGLWFGELNAGGTLGIPLGLLAVGICGWLLGGAAGGATLGALSGLALGTVSSLHPEPNVRPARPGAGMRDTRRVTLAAGAVVLVVGTVAYGLHFGLALATIVALRIGGAAYLRHLALRAILVRQGAIPLHLLTFLHHAHTRCCSPRSAAATSSPTRSCTTTWPTWKRHPLPVKSDDRVRSRAAPYPKGARPSPTSTNRWSPGCPMRRRAGPPSWHPTVSPRNWPGSVTT